MNKKGFIFCFLVLVFTFLFIGNVKASINTTSGKFPDLPFGCEDYNFIIVTRTDGSNMLYTWSLDSDVIRVGGDLPSYPTGSLRFYKSSSSYSSDVKRYIIEDGIWSYYGNTKNNTSYNYVSIIATSVNIYGNSTSVSKFYEAGYGLIEDSPYTINFHLNDGWLYNSKIEFGSDEDFSLTLYPDEIEDFFTNIDVNKLRMSFDGWYYDENFTRKFSLSDDFPETFDLYAKFITHIYNTNNIDYIEFKFDNIPLRSTNISYDYEFRSVTYNGRDDTIDFGQPFGREYYTGCDDVGYDCSPNLKYKDKLFYDLGFVGYYYTHDENLIFNDNPDHITTSYSIIIPLENSIGNYLYLNFNSDYDYEMIIHYKTDEDSINSYLKTIDLTGKYGAVFLPWYDNDRFVDDDTYYLTNFSVVGNVDIQVTDSRDFDNYNILQLYSMNYCNYTFENQKNVPYNCDILSGIFQFKIYNKTANQTLRFVNHSYTEYSDRKVLITYDTRFFNYVILDTPFSSGIVEDPVTGEDFNVGLGSFYDQFNKDSMEGSKNTFKTAFNRFVNPIKFIFKNVTNLYNNYLNSSLQHYFFLVFSLALLFLIIRVIF